MKFNKHIFLAMGLASLSLSSCSNVQRERQFSETCVDILSNFQGVLEKGATSKGVWNDFLTPDVGSYEGETGRSQRDRFLAGWKQGDQYEIVNATCYPNDPSKMLIVIVSTPQLGNIYFGLSRKPDGSYSLYDMFVGSELGIL